MRTALFLSAAASLCVHLEYRRHRPHEELKPTVPDKLVKLYPCSLEKLAGVIQVKLKIVKVV